MPVPLSINETPFHKKDFNNVVKSRMGWDDRGKETIEKHTRKSLKILRIHNKDQYDYPIMAITLEYDVHLLITDN